MRYGGIGGGSTARRSSSVLPHRLSRLKRHNSAKSGSSRSFFGFRDDNVPGVRKVRDDERNEYERQEGGGGGGSSDDSALINANKGWNKKSSRLSGRRSSSSFVKRLSVSLTRGNKKNNKGASVGSDSYYGDDGDGRGQRFSWNDVEVPVSFRTERAISNDSSVGARRHQEHVVQEDDEQRGHHHHPHGGGQDRGMLPPPPPRRRSSPSEPWPPPIPLPPPPPPRPRPPAEYGAPAAVETEREEELNDNDDDDDVDRSSYDDYDVYGGAARSDVGDDATHEYLY